MKMKQGLISFLSSTVSILVGLLFCFILLLFVLPANTQVFANGQQITNPLQIAWMKFSSMLTMGMTQTGMTSALRVEKAAKLLYSAAPILMTGLSVGFAFKTGLFNIGASGQFTVGAVTAIAVALLTTQKGVANSGAPWYICLLAAMVAGAIWGFFPGIFKALFNVNEVITSIMFNWIGLHIVNLFCMNVPKMVTTYWGGYLSNQTQELPGVNKAANLPSSFLGQFFPVGQDANGVARTSEYINIGILIAIAVAIIIWVVLEKTTFGYELKACGNNKNASLYAGINAKRNIVLSMVIAGALSGIGGGLLYLSGRNFYYITKILLPHGFNGITVALLASSHPIGIIFSSLFVSYINVGGESLQPTYAKEMVDIAVAVILYLSAFSLLIKTGIGRFIKLDKTNVNRAVPAAVTKSIAKPTPILDKESVESGE